ncbi:6-carboxytetrahydropterin synthase [Massilia sp. CMS3.1]|uniref:6-carboxytetrahydropterin synthase n=1 Tax=Massilia sp. CMS3.1 TaxID=3373083 RepID=UPI003EE44336
MFELSQNFYFDAAHTLDRAIETESSKRIHGHTYNAEVSVRGERDPETGMVLDLGELRKAVEVVRLELDHRFLDDVPDLGAPTLENLCKFIQNSVRRQGIELYRVAVWRERSGDRCTLLPS